jgi:hypothetical protein
MRGPIRHVNDASTAEDALMSGILRDAARGKGNFGLGSASPAQADKVGKAWVGENYSVSEDGTALISNDGLRQYRLPQCKPKLGVVQANLEGRYVPRGPWQSNGHLDISGTE